MRPDEASTVWKGTMLAVTVERWGDARREIVERADSAAIVAVDREHLLVLVRQSREAPQKALVELPAGTVDEAEGPRRTAERELREETGLRGGRWRAGPVFWSSPGFCRERIHSSRPRGSRKASRARRPARTSSSCGSPSSRRSSG